MWNIGMDPGKEIDTFWIKKYIKVLGSVAILLGNFIKLWENLYFSGLAEKWFVGFVLKNERYFNSCKMTIP